MSKLIGSSLTKSFLLKSNSSAKSKVLVNSCVYLDHVSVKQKKKRIKFIEEKRNLIFFSILIQAHNYSSQGKGFLSGFIDNLKEEFNKNKEMKESVKKFREEAKKLEQSDALRDARNKYVSLNSKL